MGIVSWAAFFAFLTPAGPALSPPRAALPAIVANDNRAPAGRMVANERQVALEARWGRWFPDGPAGDSVPMQAFAQAGGPPSIPGPIIRVPVGTTVVVRLHDALPGRPLSVHGLMDRPALRDRAVELAYGQTRVVRFHARAAGTYYYWGTTSGATVDRRFRNDSQLSGAIVVDPPGVAHANDRVFVVGQWVNPRKANGKPDLDYELDVINGLAWPHTERLSYAQGAEVRWRWINTSFGPHPLHLHGFYFYVDSRGNGVSDVTYPRDGLRDMRVTELLEPGRTFAMTWRAQRAGNWLFHCHLTYHGIAHLPLADMLKDKPSIAGEDYEDTYTRHAAMGGLILGFTVRAAKGAAVAHVKPARRIGLVIEPGASNRIDAPFFRISVTEPGKPDLTGAGTAPPIVLTRGVPVAIDVINHLPDPTSIHWHGIEMADSYYDGVVGFSGSGTHVAPMVDPDKTFEVRMTPPRAGTFIYHTHMGDVYQLRGGLAGPLIVLDPGQRFDPSTDHVFLLTTTHTLADAGNMFVNGTSSPAPLVVHAGVPQRLRFINMSTFWTRAVVSLSAGGKALPWTPGAVDGATLPRARRVAQPAVSTVTIGETRDFWFTPRSGEMVLQFWADPNYGLVRVPVRVI